MDKERLQRLLGDERRARMVGWFDPPVFARSGVLVAIANLFGRHSDRRLIEALANQPQAIFDYTQEAGDFWLDYVSDLGDGWNSTYGIAHALARPTLELKGQTGDGVAETTRAGRVLVFGGDEVYPYPSREAYEQRTEKPYAMAFVGHARCPDVFAVPGNHDWYDSLIAFSRTFCRPERGFGGCRTQQTRSYFALRLPHHWWLLAIDLQLGADLDEPQVQYFQRVSAAMEDDARIVLCVPEPQWLLKEAYPEDTSYEDDAMSFLERRILKRPVQVFLTGDLHHYRRHESPAGVQRIVDGGGGAFLHPTHTRDKRLADGSVERVVYPPRAKSWRLAWRNLLFVGLNPRFFWIPATLYSLSAWFASASLGPEDLETVQLALMASLQAAVRDPFDGLWLLAIIAAFVFFTDTHIKWYRVLGGVTHAVSHLGTAFLIGWTALLLTTDGLGLAYGGARQLLLAGAFTFIVGGIAGSVIMGLYLLLSLQIFGRHSEQAFSSLHIQDYKSWLRLKIDAAGVLTIFAVGIDRVPRKWKKSDEPANGMWSADDARATAPHLIDIVRL
jgi:hypothetical protein